jgi:hypothetical protein
MDFIALPPEGQQLPATKKNELSSSLPLEQGIFSGSSRNPALCQKETADVRELSKLSRVETPNCQNQHFAKRP